MKKIAKTIVLTALLAFAANVNAQPVKIAVSQFVEHPALNAVLKGFKDDLAENAVEVEYKEYNAHGNMGTASQIATQFASDAPDMIVAIATPNAQACAQV